LNSNDAWEEKYSRTLRIAAMIGAVISCTVMGITITLFIFQAGFEFWRDLVRAHFAATVGLMGACILSFAVVVFLRQTEGPIEFDALGLRFRGAAGQVVLWLLCIIVLTLCASYLWPAS
jgi:hypothetical protein